ncbi:putative carbohydrate-binding module family 13 protein [Lyophyllum shimeji]|uniref:Carbohydrate-binding module family 13 protein n=1 Tax=Lyophyllum shimeji TaxID=47721 RepID=A0A9P3UPF8_LYOSH|nr:putative carbohydrate-binding module family 13 protein [Lyophyllum shimeji]
MSAPELVQSGFTYRITNAKSGTVMDLSGLDNKTVIGYPNFNTNNQQWALQWTNIGWTFRSVSSGLYLGIDGPLADGTRLVAKPEPFGWHIWHDEVDSSTYRIFVPNTTLNVDLNNHGSTVPGTAITLWYRWLGIHQTWRFERV